MTLATAWNCISQKQNGVFEPKKRIEITAPKTKVENHYEN